MSASVEAWTWHVDAVTVHLWALALEAGEVVDLGECPECDGLGVVYVGGERAPAERGCPECSTSEVLSGSGRDLRSLAFLVGRAAERECGRCAGDGWCGWCGGRPARGDDPGVNGHPDCQICEGSGVCFECGGTERHGEHERAALRTWADHQAEARAVVADARLADRDTKPDKGPLGFGEPERVAGEWLPESMRDAALRADLARWLLMWLDGVRCRRCVPTEGPMVFETRDDARVWCKENGHRQSDINVIPSTGWGVWSRDAHRWINWGEYRNPLFPCHDCWGTGKLGRARAMEAALSKRTPAAEEAAE